MTNKYNKIFGISMLVLGISSLVYGIMFLPALSSDCGIGIFFGFWYGFVFIITGFFKIRFGIDLLKKHLKYIIISFFVIGLLDAIIGYVFLHWINRLIINIYLLLFFVLPASLFLLRKNKTPGSKK